MWLRLFEILVIAFRSWRWLILWQSEVKWSYHILWGIELISRDWSQGAGARGRRERAPVSSSCSELLSLLQSMQYRHQRVHLTCELVFFLNLAESALFALIESNIELIRAQTIFEGQAPQCTGSTLLCRKLDYCLTLGDFLVVLYLRFESHDIDCSIS